MSDNLFIINYDIDDLDPINGIACCGIYNELEKAKEELKNIFNKTPDYKFFGYKIMVYNLVNNEYKFSNKIYIYKFDEFIEYFYNNK
jgi:hypothetical protein